MRKVTLKDTISCISGRDANVRTALIRKNIIFSFLIKGWSGLVLLLLVPVTLNCLGEYQNGVWLTLSSLLVWIDHLDIGLGNGLRNKLAATMAHGDMREARELVSSTFFMLIFIILPMMLVLCAIAWHIDVYSLLNVVHGEIHGMHKIVVLCIILVCSTFIFKFIGNFYMGLQLPAVNNLIVTCGQTLTLVLTYAVWLTGHGSFLVIAVVNTASPLIVYIMAYPYTFFVRYKALRPSFSFFRIETAKGLFTIGIKFFILQMSGIILFFTSNIIISHLLSPASVTPYQIVYRYFTIVILAFTILSTPYWSATTDAYEKGDMGWIIQSHRRMMKMTRGLQLLIILMAVVSPWFFNIWIGEETYIPVALTAVTALYVGVLIESLSFSYFLNGVGALFLQVIFTAGAALAFIPVTYLAFSLVPDSCSIVLAMTVVNLPSMICNRMQFKKITTYKANGIWTR